MTAPSKVKAKTKYLSLYIYIYIYIYCIDLSLLEIDPLYELFDLKAERLKVITEHDSSVNTNGPRILHGYCTCVSDQMFPNQNILNTNQVRK